MQKFRKAITFLFFIFLFFTQYFVNGSELPFNSTANGIRKAVTLVVTPKGQRYFSTNLEDVLLNNGVNLNTIEFDKIQKVFPEVSTEQLFTDAPETVEAIRSAKRFLQQFFDLKMRNHEIGMILDDLYIKTSWENISLEFSSPNQLINSENSANLIVTLNVQSQLEDIQIASSKLELFDFNNSFLGSLIFRDLSLFMPRQRNTFNFQVPILVGKNSLGNFFIEVLRPTTNLKDLKLDFKYRSPIIFPRYSLSGHKSDFKLNTKNAEIFLLEHKGSILESLKSNLNKYIAEDVPGVITRNINDFLKDGIGEVNTLVPPSAPHLYVSQFFWRLSLSDISFQRNYLNIDLDLSMLDPNNPNVPELSSELKANENFKLVPTGSHSDFEIAIDQGFFNRALQLSYERGYLKKIEAGSQKLTLARQPILNFKSRQSIVRSEYTHRTSTVTLFVEKEVDGFFQNLTVKSPLRVEFDLNVEFFKNANGLISLKVVGIEEESIFVPKEYIKMFAGQVRKQVRQEVMTSALSVIGTVLMDELPLPENIAGVPIAVLDIAIDKRGYLIIPLEIEDEN